MNPRARSEGLLIQVVGTDTLVYDRQHQTSCCLNVVASAVWRHCDGTHSVAEIAELVAREVTLPEGASPISTVWSSLEELRSNALLLEAKDDAREAAAWTMGRRQILKASAAAVALPSVDKIFAPSMASAHGHQRGTESAHAVFERPKPP